MERMRRYVLMILLVATWMSVQAEVYRTQPFVKEIKTLQVIADEDFMKLPVMVFGETDLSKSAIEISFDYLVDEQPWLAYSLVHCDANWEQDGLGEMDFADGFLPVRIEDVEASFNTFVSYFHYSIKFPNEDVQLTASGNYAVLIHPEDDADEVLAVATFSVSEQMAFIKGSVSSNTDIDFKKSHQQLSLELSWAQSKLPYLDVANDIRLIVRQNRRDNTRREVSVPTKLEAGRAVYEHNRDLIFEAGNNYRRFEFTDVRYAGLGVENVEYRTPYYYVTLRTDKVRQNGSYFYDKDQNGRFLIHALRVDDEAIEAEYFKAVFTLAGREERGEVFLSGDFTYGQETDDFLMEYDADAAMYRKKVLLKQGAYNYLYLVGGKTATMEGDYYETENEYDIYVYYHPNGARYDRLLGIATIE